MAGNGPKSSAASGALAISAHHKAVRRPGAFVESLAGSVLSAPAAFLIFLLIIGPAAAVIVICFTDWEFGCGCPVICRVGEFPGLVR